MQHNTQYTLHRSISTSASRQHLRWSAQWAIYIKIYIFLITILAQMSHPGHMWKKEASSLLCCKQLPLLQTTRMRQWDRPSVQYSKLLVLAFLDTLLLLNHIQSIMQGPVGLHHHLWRQCCKGFRELIIVYPCTQSVIWRTLQQSRVRIKRTMKAK